MQMNGKSFVHPQLFLLKHEMFATLSLIVVVMSGGCHSWENDPDAGVGRHAWEDLWGEASSDSDDWEEGESTPGGDFVK